MTAGRLAISGVRKQYGGTVALDGFALDVAPGEVRGLIGENGSGKSTAMKVLSGEVAPDLGEVRAGGTPLPALDPASRLKAGVGVVMQDPHLCDDLTVAENLALGRLGRRGLVRWRKVREDATCPRTTSTWSRSPGSWRGTAVSSGSTRPRPR
ncbi:ATP-binding cassette domain-containing protein [Actinocorallia libanotica]|uniref:ABC transporter domain-containing protein n=1 Tax=Actinocorallia libanotica TaxID=46162 RepID=A0ABP4CAN9_9ACTN